MSPAEQRDYSSGYRALVLAILFLIYMINYVDRALLNIVGQAVKIDLALSDFQLGLASGIAFALINGVMSIPIARLAEYKSRVSIITGALAFWSIMTALCGAAQNFWQLILARGGVGIGEAGGVAPSQSLIADYYPANKRATAIAIFGAATPAGMLIGALGSGWITEQFSWRVAFVAIGLPGVLIAIIAALLLKEPPRGHSDGLNLKGDPPSFGAVLRRVWSQPAFVHLIIATSILNFAFFGYMTFLHPYLVRSMQVGYSDAATFYGLVTGISCGIGYVGSGLLADRLGRRDRRWYLGIPGVGALIAAPAFTIGFLQTDLSVAAPFFFIGGMGACSWYGAVSAVMHSLVEPRMRATAVAISAFVILIFGVGLGPAFVGFLSDRFGDLIATNGCSASVSALCDAGSTSGLRAALIVVSPLYVWAAIHYAIGARHLANKTGE